MYILRGVGGGGIGEGEKDKGEECVDEGRCVSEDGTERKEGMGESD